MLEEILEFNKKFVENRGYEKYITILIRKSPSFPVWIPA